MGIYNMSNMSRQANNKESKMTIPNISPSISITFLIKAFQTIYLKIVKKIKGISIKKYFCLSKNSKNTMLYNKVNKIYFS